MNSNCGIHHCIFTVLIRRCPWQVVLSWKGGTPRGEPQPLRTICLVGVGRLHGDTRHVHLQHTAALECLMQQGVETPHGIAMCMKCRGQRLDRHEKVVEQAFCDFGAAGVAPKQPPSMMNHILDSSSSSGT